MAETQKTVILDEGAIARALMRISFEITEKNHGAKKLLLAGIKTRGVYLADRIADMIGKEEGVRPPVIEIDVSPLRDDLPREQRGEVAFPDLPGLVQATVILVDDVLFTGRTARAAIEAIALMGRAERIQLAVLIDRGHRELPIRPDYTGKNLPTARAERVSVFLKEVDGEDSVQILKL